MLTPQVAGEDRRTRAAQYIRMSTEHQQYSTENQADVIRDYALARGGNAVRGKNIQNGRAGLFEIIRATNSSAALEATKAGVGRALLVNQGGPSGDIAAFRANSVDIVTIDHTGHGFFHNAITATTTLTAATANVGVGRFGVYAGNVRLDDFGVIPAAPA